MTRWLAAVAVLALVGCSAIEQAPPPSPQPSSVITPGPVEEIFEVISRAESTVGGEAFAIRKIDDRYFVRLLAGGEIVDKMVSGDEMVRASRGVERAEVSADDIAVYLERARMSLEDAIDAASAAHAGTIIEASIASSGEDLVRFDVVLDDDGETKVVIDGVTGRRL